MQSDLCTVHAKKLRSNSRIEIPGTDSLCRGFRLEGFRCFSKTLLLLHRPASYGRIVVGVGEGVGPTNIGDITVNIRPFHRIITFKTRIERLNLICPEKYTPVRAIVEHDRHSVSCVFLKAERNNKTDLLLQRREGSLSSRIDRLPSSLSGDHSHSTK